MPHPLRLAECRSEARLLHLRPPVHERTREHLRGSRRTEDLAFVHTERDQGRFRADHRFRGPALRALEALASPSDQAAFVRDSFCSTRHGGEHHDLFVVEVSVRQTGMIYAAD